jgi:chromosome segregation ATPase
MSQFSHDTPVVKPAERRFVPPLPQEMPVAEKVSRISPELQAEQDAVQEQMAEARVALQTANEEIGVLRETIRELEGKRGLTEEEQVDLAESKQQLASYEQDLAHIV